VAVPYANLTNPQTLNLYSMVADDPESFADLDGHGATMDALNPFLIAEEGVIAGNTGQANEKASATPAQNADNTHGVYADHEKTNISPAGDTGETKIGFIEGTATHKGVTEGDAGVKGGGVDITLKNHEGKSSLELQGFTGEAGVKGRLSTKGVKVGADAEAAVFRADATNTFKIGNYKLTIGGNLTAISAGAHADLNIDWSKVSFKAGAGASWGAGAGLSISLNRDTP